MSKAAREAAAAIGVGGKVRVWLGIKVEAHEKQKEGRWAS